MSKTNHTILVALIICLSLAACSSNKSHVKLNGQWKVLYSDRTDHSGFLDTYEHDVILFDNGLATLNVHGTDSSFQFKYKLKGSKIVTDTTQFDGDIKFYPDTLTIEHDGFISYLVPIETYNPEILSTELVNILSDDTWELVFEDSRERIDFSSESYRDYPNTQTCVRHYYSKYWSYRNLCYWGSQKVRSEVFLFIAQDGFDSETFQVYSVAQDTIRLKFNGWGYKSDLTLERKRTLSAFEADSLKSIISSKGWVADSIVYHNNFDSSNEEREWSKHTDSLSARIIRPETETILKSEFLEASPEFQFNDDGSFAIELPSGLYSLTNWELASDGGYILTGKRENPKSYIELISVEENEMKIRYIQNLKLRPNGRKFVPYDCTITLKN